MPSSARLGYQARKPAGTAVSSVAVKPAPMPSSGNSLSDSSKCHELLLIYSAARRPEGQAANDEREGEGDGHRGHHVEAEGGQPADGDGMYAPAERPGQQSQRRQQPQHRRERRKALRQQDHPEWLRLDQYMVELAASDAPADIGDVVVKEYVRNHADQ